MFATHTWPSRWSLTALAAVVIALVAVGVRPGTAAAVAPVPGTVGCPAGTAPQEPSAAYEQSVDDALASGPDVWGQQAIDRPNGPSFHALHRLKPIRYGIGPAANGSALADSWAYYIPFGQPTGPSSRDEIALHVADGSQIISDKSGNRSMRVFVGTNGAERYGECWTSLAEPRLRDGYWPVLETAYHDHDGIAYRQESFATYIPGTQLLASYVKVTAKATATSPDHTQVRFQACPCGLTQDGDRLVAGGKTYLYFEPGASFTGGRDLTYDLDLSDGRPHAVYLVRVNAASADAPVGLVPGAAAHRAARAASEAYWRDRLAEGGTFRVPERRIMNAQRNMLIQNLLMNWRYSLGNAYEAFYQPESSDNVENLGHYGYLREYRAGLQDLLPLSKGANRRNWEMGEKLLRAADLYWLTRDPSFVDANTPTYESYAEDIATQQRNDPNGLLEKQQYSSDINHDVYGLHQIARAMYGLKAIVAVWRVTGHQDLADRYAPVAQALSDAVQRALAASNQTLPDGSLFTATMLYEGEQAYEHITDTTLGSYWNLVVQYGLDSHIYPPGSDRALRAIQYLYEHGSRLQGSLRVRLGGLDDVYGVEQARFLADNDQADQLALTMYGNLANSHTSRTFIAGESDNVGPIGYKWPLQFGGCSTGEPCQDIADAWSADDAYRGLYNPPNSANNTLFLTALRLLLVQQVTDDADVPQGLRLAFATPRSWLGDGRSIAVRDAPTGFGPLSYAIHSRLRHNRVLARVDVPSREQPGSLQLRLRTPGRGRMLWVKVNGRQYDRFDPATQTIDLSGLTGTLHIDAHVRRGGAAG